MKRLIRGSQFKIGDHVRVDGDSAGNYYGYVVEKHYGLQLLNSYTDEVESHPGITVNVYKWDGMTVDYKMLINAWDHDCTLID